MPPFLTEWRNAMIHVYKSGGKWKTKGGQDYTIKAISLSQKNKHIDDGWFLSLEDALAIESTSDPIPEQGSDYEVKLRAEIKELGGTPGGRSSIETLEKQLASLKAE